ncbi:MAG: hypothetical protein ABUT20_26070 [Bacteroidota bacterium]
MNSDQQKIKSLLLNLDEGKKSIIRPALKENISLFTQRAINHSVDSKVIKQLVDLYEVADFFHYEIILGFHHCNDLAIFEWWNDKELWLGQRDFNTLRWSNGKFSLGDANTISYSIEHEFETLIELIEGCVKEIRKTEES